MSKNKRTARTETSRNPDPAFPYMRSLSADIRLVGGPTILTPFPQTCSAARLDMFRSHLSQAVVVDGCEFPRIFTGKEMDFGRYEMQAGAAEREQDGQILAVIPKYQVRMEGINQIHECPKRTVIWRGLDDDAIHCFDIDTHYTDGADGFGYRNVLENEHLLQKDTHIFSDTIFAHSPARNGNQYNLGVNANVLYATDLDTIEDAFPISRTLANKMRSLEISRKSITVRANEHPINHFGDEVEAKFLPDIGDCVGDDGVLCAFRPVDVATFAADMNPLYMREIQPQHDRIIRVPPGAKIVDIDFYPTSRRDQIPWSIFGQVEKYIDSIKRYWETIIKTATELEGRYTFSPRFNTLVERAYLQYSAHGGRPKGIPSRRIKFQNRTGHAIEFLQIEVTYTIPREVNEAFKVTDRYGTYH